MKRRFNIIIELYLILIFFPTAVIVTAICAIVTIVMIPIAGDSKWGYYPGRVWARILCFLSLVKVKVEGNENIDQSKSYIFVANHQSVFDVFLVYGWLNSKFKWIMKKELRRIPLVGKACESMGHIFIDRSSAIKAKKSLDAAEKKLRNGNSIFMFPEGTRTKDGRVARFKRGAFSMAKDLHLPIIPVSIIGAYEVMPYHSAYIQPGTIKLVIHQPVDTEGINDENINDYVARVRSTVAETVDQGL